MSEIPLSKRMEAVLKALDAYAEHYEGERYVKILATPSFVDLLRDLRSCAYEAAQLEASIEQVWAEVHKRNPVRGGHVAYAVGEELNQLEAENVMLSNALLVHAVWDMDSNPLNEAAEVIDKINRLQEPADE